LLLLLLLLLTLLPVVASLLLLVLLPVPRCRRLWKYEEGIGGEESWWPCRSSFSSPPPLPPLANALEAPDAPEVEASTAGMTYLSSWNKKSLPARDSFLFRADSALNPHASATAAAMSSSAVEVDLATAADEGEDEDEEEGGEEKKKPWLGGQQEDNDALKNCPK